MNMNFGSGALPFNPQKLFGLSEAQMLSAVMTGISEAGDVAGAAMLSFFSDNMIVDDRRLAQLAQGGFGIGPVPRPQIDLAGPPAGQGLTTDPAGWPKGSVKTAGGYTVVPEGNGAWSVYNPGQKPGDKPATHVWGDPHVNEADGGRWDFTKNSDFVLPDGTRINCKTSSEHGQSVSTGLEITNGADHVSISGVDGKPRTSAVQPDGYEWRARHLAENPGRDSYRLGGDGDDWFLVRGGHNQGEVTGAHYDAKTGRYEQETNGQPYVVDPNLRPPFGSNAWGNMLRDETLDFIAGRLGLDPATATAIGGLFHADHAVTEWAQSHILPFFPPEFAGPAGFFGGLDQLGFGLGGSSSSVGAMLEVLNNLQQLGSLTNIAHALALAGNGGAPAHRNPGFAIGEPRPDRGPLFDPKNPFGDPNFPGHFTLPPDLRIPPGEWGRPWIKYWDASAAAAINKLEHKQGPITGADMMQAIIAGTADLDGQAAGQEYADFKKFVTANWDRLTPEAKAKWEAYEKTAQAAQANGQSGIPIGDYGNMIQEMMRAHYHDDSAGAAIEDLKRKPQPVSGRDMEDAIIQATSDFDNQAAGAEYRDLAKYVHENWDKLSPEAKAKWQVYEKYARRAQRHGQTGISLHDYDHMRNELRWTPFPWLQTIK